ncbi:MAG: hypothetical protein EOO87_23950 [Pedobacter sp.]|nr:MAG: hypothetical protein EOO87_23950 [Pedobacter sp.]
MPRRNNLNGIAHNITRSFFGTERYYSCGYMGDWLLQASRRLNLKKASLDVLEAKFLPEELNLHPLLISAKTLKLIIDKELINNGFDANFIVEAKIDFEFPDPNTDKTTIYCFPILIDADGRQYKPREIIEQGLEEEFNPFDELNIYPTGRKTS